MFTNTDLPGALHGEGFTKGLQAGFDLRISKFGQTQTGQLEGLSSSLLDEEAYLHAFSRYSHIIFEHWGVRRGGWR